MCLSPHLDCQIFQKRGCIFFIFVTIYMNIQPNTQLVRINFITEGRNLVSQIVDYNSYREVDFDSIQGRILKICCTIRVEVHLYLVSNYITKMVQKGSSSLGTELCQKTLLECITPQFYNFHKHCVSTVYYISFFMTYTGVF